MTMTQLIPIEGGVLATHSLGSGKPVIFINGGPGDTHHYMKIMAAPFLNQFQCIFFDQRGTGANDMVPVTQMQMVVDKVPNASMTVLDECGHIPWLDQPEIFYSKLERFLES